MDHHARDNSNIPREYAHHMSYNTMYNPKPLVHYFMIELCDLTEVFRRREYIAGLVEVLAHAD